MSKDTIHLFNNLAVKGLVANGFVGSSGQALLSNGTGVYWGSGAGFTGSKGDKGADGVFGGAAFDYTFSTATTLADPGDGVLKLNNTVFNDATTLIIHDNDDNGVSVYNFLQTIDDSTSAIKGHFTVTEKSNTTNFAQFSIVGNHVDAANSFQIPVAYLTGATSMTNGLDIIITFARTGDKGDTGFTGSFGYTGSQGDIGYTGSRGATGFVGSQGYTGSKGDIGYVGSQGVIGYTGSAGFTGSASTVAGPLGYTGSQGIGYTGSQGTTGYVGSASTEAGPIGYTGSAGAGYTGSKGDIGYTGSKGDIGYTGSKGDIGYTGSKGDIGYTGSQGDGGPQGLIGYTGSKGDIGYTGSAGPIGGSNTQVIFNDSGVANGSSSFVFDKTTGNVGIGTASPTGKFNISVPGSGQISYFFGGTSVNYTDVNTNVFRNASGSEAMRITSSGEVGIGTGSPVYKLDVNLAAGANLARFVGPEYSQVVFAGGTQSCYIQNWNSVSVLGTDSASPLAFSTNSTERMRITAGGYVGIGATSPEAVLTVFNATTFNARTSGINVHRPSAYGQYGSFAYDGDTTYFSTTYTGGGAGVYGKFIFQAYDSTSTPVQRMTIDSSGNVGIGTASPSGYGKLAVIGNIASSTDGATVLTMRANAGATNLGSYNATGSSLAFQTNASGSGEAERMRITSSGEVGIGTGSPRTKLEVTLGILMPSDGGYYGGGAYWDSVSAWRNTNSSQGGWVIRNTSGELAIHTAPSPGVAGTAFSSFSERVRIDSSGNVGIGTSSPRANLDVGTNTGGSTTTTMHLGYSGLNFYGYRLSNTMNPSLEGAGKLAFQYGTSAAWVDAVTIQDNGNVGIGTATPPSKLAIVTSSSAGSTLGSWSNSHVAIGPAVGSASGSGIGFGYNTSTDQAEIVAIAPGVGWRPLSIFSSGINFNSISGGVAVSITSSGQLGAAIDIRSPIYYDGNNTAYYADPDSTSQFNTIEAKNGSGFRTFINGSASIASQIYFGNAGNTRAWNWQLDENNDGALWSYNGTAWAKRFTVTQTGSVISSVDMRAPIFYDSNNTTYYVDPEIGTNLRGSIVLHDSGGASPLLDIRAATSSPWALRLYRSDLGGGAQMYARSASEWYHSAILTAAASMRAPIFYDEDNTAYYTDPASTSILNQINYTSMYNAADGNYGIVGNNGFFDTLNSGSAGDQLELCYSRGTFTSTSGSMRAPLFYDRDDTVYYTDPASVSNINSMLTQAAISNNVNGLRNINPGGGSSVTNSTTITGAIKIKLPETVYPMLRFTVRVYTYDGLSFDIYCGGHTSDGFWYNTFAYMTTQNRSPLNVRFTYDGTNMYVMIGNLDTVWSYPQVFITEVQVGYTNYEYSRWDDGWVISFDASTYHTVAITHLVSPPTSSINNTNGAYASIYYDSNNTACYVDPESGSVLGGQVLFAGGTKVATNGDVYARRDAGTTGVYYFADGGSKYLYHDGTNYNFGSAGVVLTPTSFRGPVFYDSDNTAYYFDGATTGVSLTAAGTLESSGGIGVAGAGATNDPYGRISVTRPNDANYSYYGLTRQGALGMGMGIDTNNLFWVGSTGAGYNGTRTSIYFQTNTSGDVTAASSLRAPIFYDSNDTAYWINPNNSQSIRTVGDWRSDSGDWTGEFSGKIQYHANNWYFQSAGEWIFRRSDAAEAFSVSQSGFGTFLSSIRVGSGAAASDIYMGDSDNGERRLHCNSDRIGFLTQAEGWGSYCSDNGDWTTEYIGYALASSRAPIFYDYNNTAYLFDGDGTSRWNISSQDSNHVFNQCGVGVVGSYDSTKFQTVFAMGSSYNSNAAGTSITGAYGLWWSHPNAGGQAATLDSHGLIAVINGANVAQLGRITSAVASMRAPIFYDLDNTGYYCNPDSTSNFLDMYVQGGFGGTSNSASYLYAAIEVRERGFGGAQDDTWATAPRLAFHWGGRVASQIAMSSSGRITILNNPGTAVEAFESGNFYAPIFYDSNDTAYSVDPTGTSRTGLIRADYYGRAAHNTGFLRGGYNNIGASEGQTSPIYCIGSSYEPGTTTLGIMYGIGFTSGGSFFPSGASGWGMYTADNGVSRIFLSAASGDITATGNITAYASDRRLKTNIKPISNAIDKLMRINGVEFDWVDNIQEIGFIPQTMHETGVIAQEIQAVIPDAVKIAPFNKNATDISGIDNEYLTVDKEKIIPLLIEAIKEQQARINRLEETVNNLMGNK